MFKALVVTSRLIKHPHSTLNRQIISQTKQQVEYSPAKSPTKPQLSSSKPQQSPPKPQQSSSRSQQSQKRIQQFPETWPSRYPLKVTEIQGNIKLFHEYQLQRIEDNLNKLIIQKKRQEIANLAHLKTNILAIVDITSLENKQKILQKLAQVKEEIDTVDVFVQKTQNSQINHHPKHPHKSDHFTIVIYFHTSIMSEQFHKLCYKQFTHLPVYLKEVVILQRQSQEQISYKQVLTSFKYVEPLGQENNNLGLNKKDITQLQSQDRKWIELPQCVNCLLKLEFQVTGIDQKLLYMLAESQAQRQNQQKTYKKPQKTCSTCKILAQHRKQTEIHRKLSSSSDHKDHNQTHCDDCKQKSDIWICMVCSRVGCGRYKNADAYKHFVKSGHIITIDLETERVWNYMSDCFSHKLLKNVSDVTNVRFPEISRDQSQKIQQSKLEAAFWQYCSVFSQQMQRQRIFYQNIKISEQQKFQQQDNKLETLIKQLQKQKEEKSIQVKRTLKKKVKTMKKQKELEEKVGQERQILNEQEECLGVDWLRNSLENDEDVKRKRKELQQLEDQLNQVLAQLSSG